MDSIKDQQRKCNDVVHEEASEQSECDDAVHEEASEQSECDDVHEEANEEESDNERKLVRFIEVRVSFESYYNQELIESEGRGSM